MARFVLVAYLSVTTVIGPALCCCNVGQIVALASHSDCCGKKVAKADPQPRHSHHHHGNHGHGKHEHCDHHHGQAPASSPASGSNEQTPAPAHDDHPRNCPCGKHFASLIAAFAETSALQHGSWLFGTAWGFVALPELTNPDVFTADHQPGANGRPVLLFGREMLRAYKTLRC